VFITNCIFRYNQANIGGGAFAVQGSSSITIEDSQLYGNTLGDRSVATGGGMLIVRQGSSSVRITRCQIYDNSVGAQGTNGGGVVYFNHFNASVTFSSCNITNNDAGEKSNGGGVIQFDLGTEKGKSSSQATFHDCRITQNKAMSGVGLGGVSAHMGTGIVHYQSCTIEHNKALQVSSVSPQTANIPRKQPLLFLVSFSSDFDASCFSFWSLWRFKYLFSSTIIA
jgi:hypothetical protein